MASVGPFVTFTILQDLSEAKTRSERESAELSVALAAITKERDDLQVQLEMETSQCNGHASQRDAVQLEVNRLRTHVSLWNVDFLQHCISISTIQQQHVKEQHSGRMLMLVLLPCVLPVEHDMPSYCSLRPNQRKDVHVGGE